LNNISAAHKALTRDRYAKCLAASSRVCWDIEDDVIRGRSFDAGHFFLPEGLSRISRMSLKNEHDRRMMSQIQGRTYANMFCLVERFIGAKMLDIGAGHALRDQTAFQALLGFTTEELKHQELFRRIDLMSGAVMPRGYRFLPKPDDVARVVLSRSTWAVLALTCHIEIFTQIHYRESIEPNPALSPLFKDVLLYHWKEESQHAILDELEWAHEDARLSDTLRESAITDLIALVGAVDGLLQMQSKADAMYFAQYSTSCYSSEEHQAIADGILHAYRWQYIVSGVQAPRFMEQLGAKLTMAQMNRVAAALSPLMAGF